MAASPPLREMPPRRGDTAGGSFETEHRRKDGTVFPAEVSSRSAEIDGQPHVFAIVRDISERREHQVRIEQLGRLYRVLSQINEVIFRASERAELLGVACRTLVESGRSARLDPGGTTRRPKRSSGWRNTAKVAIIRRSSG